MKRIEAYGTPEGEAMLRFSSGETIVYTEEQHDFTERMMTFLENYFPKALSGLRRWFAKSKPNKPYYEFLIVRQFILCNFFEYDHRLDIDEDGNFHFEFVQCPVRATCLYNGHRCADEGPNEIGVCNPEFASELSPEEYRVMTLFYTYPGITCIEIAEMLCKSPHTVENQKKHAMRRVGAKSLAEFIGWARVNNVFN